MSCGKVNRSRRARKVGALGVQLMERLPAGRSDIPELTMGVRDHDVRSREKPRETDLDNFAVLDRDLLGIRQNNTGE